ncbi:Putative nitroreductase family protein SACOL0874, partial [Terribacillus sp. AE2B 122]
KTAILLKAESLFPLYNLFTQIARN